MLNGLNSTEIEFTMVYANTKMPLHSDQEMYYINRKLRLRLWRYRIMQSMSCHGNCWDTLSIEDCRRLKRKKYQRQGI